MSAHAEMLKVSLVLMAFLSQSLGLRLWGRPPLTYWDDDNQVLVGSPGNLSGNVHHQFLPQTAPFPGWIASTQTDTKRAAKKGPIAAEVRRRILAPCAGGTEAARMSGHSPVYLENTESSQRDLLRERVQALTQEAIVGQGRTLSLLWRYRRERGVEPPAESAWFTEALAPDTFSDPLVLVQGQVQIGDALQNVYSRFAFGAWLLENVISEEMNGHPSFARSMRTLLEGGIYNLLCGIKGILHATSSKVPAHRVARVTETAFPVAASIASRFARDYIIIKSISELFGHTVQLFRVIGEYS